MTDTTYKALTRSSTNTMLAGVCAGLGDYLNIDPTVVRLLFVLGFFLTGPAIFLASDASSWVSGMILPMDGGNLAKNAGGSHPGMPGETASL